MRRDSATLLDLQSAIEKGIAFLDCSNFEAFQSGGKTDLDEVWKTVTVDLPKLQIQIDGLILQETPSK